MIRVKLFAARHIKTGYYLPAPQGKGGRGGTWLTPKQFGNTTGTDRHKLIPRVWATKRAASCALYIWLKGKQHWHWDSEGYQEYDRTTVDPRRKKEEWEIVDVTMELP